MQFQVSTRMLQSPDPASSALVPHLVVHRVHAGRLRQVLEIPFRDLPEDPRVAQELDELAAWLARQQGMTTGYAMWWSGPGPVLELSGPYDGPVWVEPFAEGERWTPIPLPEAARTDWPMPAHPTAWERAHRWRQMA